MGTCFNSKKKRSSLAFSHSSISNSFSISDPHEKDDPNDNVQDSETIDLIEKFELSLQAEDYWEETKQSNDQIPKTTTYLHHRQRGERHYMNNYLLLEKIGEGSYGKVRKGINVSNNQTVAIKIINKAKLKRKRTFQIGKAATSLWDNVLQELAILKKMDHPNIVKMHEVINDERKDKLYIIMEYLPKGPIMAAGNPTKKIDDMEMLRQYMRDICMALEYLHTIGIVHTDIKPENLLVDAENRLKIADFGVSMLLENERRSGKKIQKFQGTPAFTAPETTIGKPFHPWPLDIWAVGVTFFILGHGKLPFPASNVIELYKAIQYEEPEYDSDLDPGYLACVRSCLHKNPKKRVDITELKKNAWITKNGEEPLPSQEICNTLDTTTLNEVKEEANTSDEFRISHLLLNAKHAFHRISTSMKLGGKSLSGTGQEAKIVPQKKMKTLEES